jgi:phage terminase small subunit
MRNPALNNLSPQKRMFVMEYLKHFNGSKAGITVGLAEGSGTSWLIDPEIQAAIEEQMAERILRMEIDADWLLEEMKQVWEADVSDIYYPETNTLRPVHEWPPIWRKMTTGVQTIELYRGTGENRELTGYSKKVKSLKESKLLELIGKHVNVKAWSNKLELVTEKELEDALLAGRKRVQTQDDDELNFM